MSFSSNKPHLVRRLIRRYGAACTYCRSPLTDPVDGRQEPTTRTVDHVIPRARGGTSSIRNLVLACQRCNGAKGSMLPLEFVLARQTGLL